MTDQFASLSNDQLRDIAFRFGADGFFKYSAKRRDAAAAELRARTRGIPRQMLIDMGAAYMQASGQPAAMQAAWHASPGPELVRALSAVAEHFPRFSDSGDAPEDDAVEVLFSWGEIRSIRAALRKAGVT